MSPEGRVLGNGWGVRVYKNCIEEVRFELKATSFLSALKPLLHTGRVDSNRRTRQLLGPSGVQQAPRASPLVGWGLAMSSLLSCGCGQRADDGEGNSCSQTD